jgi:hypothetical protein
VSDNVYVFPVSDARPIARAQREQSTSPAEVLQGAVAALGDIETVIVLGVKRDGTLFAATSAGHVADIMLLMERAKCCLLGLFGEDRFT